MKRKGYEDLGLVELTEEQQARVREAENGLPSAVTFRADLSLAAALEELYWPPDCHERASPGATSITTFAEVAGQVIVAGEDLVLSWPHRDFWG